MFKKVLSFFLVACLVFGVLSGCGNSDKNTSNPVSNEGEVTEKESEQGGEEAIDDTQNNEIDPFPGANLGGVTINLKIGDWANPDKVDEAFKEKWVARKKEVEEKFNCILTFDKMDGVDWAETAPTIIASVAAGDPIIDFADLSRYFVADLIANDALVDITSDITSYNMPKAYYKQGCEWAGKVVGFNIKPFAPFDILVYNRDLIKAAGMEKTPGELFKEGKWSFEDFYDYCAELKTKLPEGIDTFGIHALNWARGASYANGAAIMDPETYIPSYTSEAFYQSVELFQKLVANGLALNAIEVTRDDGTIGYNWNETQAGFGEQTLAISHGADWSFEEWQSKFDMGIVPFPWGPNVTIKNNDYTTLDSNYASFYKDNAVYAMIKGAEKKATPEQFKNLIFSYFAEEGQQLIKDYEKEQKGEAIVSADAGMPRNFSTDLDIEIWDWYWTRGKFEPTDTTAVSNVFFRALYKVASTNESARSAFESVIGQDTLALMNAGLVDPNLINPELKAKVAEYEATAPAE